VISIDKSAAEQALAEIGQEKRRSAELYNYSYAAPPIFITGMMWFVTDLAFQFIPAVRDWIWPTATLVFIPIYIAVAARQARQARVAGKPKLDGVFWKVLGSWLLIAGFIFGVLVVFPPDHGTQIHSLIGLIMALGYAGFGLFTGVRLFILGVAMGVLTLLVHTYVVEWYTFFMGVVGGGGMMLGALWLRRV
jgi:cell division protein FtsW (lipid II flippase)